MLESSHPRKNGRFVQLSLYAAYAAVPLAWLAPFTPPPLEVVEAAIGLILFVTAMLIGSYAVLTKEMRSASDLGFVRNRDALLYASSPVGMDWRLMVLGAAALATMFLVGSGWVGRPSSGGALLSFSVFALAGAIARLRRRWPSDDATR